MDAYAGESQMRSELESLSALKKAPGWKVFTDFMELQKEYLLSGLESASSADAVMRTAGALNHHRFLTRWVDNQIRAHELSLKNMADARTAGAKTNG